MPVSVTGRSAAVQAGSPAPPDVRRPGCTWTRDMSVIPRRASAARKPGSALICSCSDPSSAMGGGWTPGPGFPGHRSLVERDGDAPRSARRAARTGRSGPPGAAGGRPRPGRPAWRARRGHSRRAGCRGPRRRARGGWPGRPRRPSAGRGGGGPRCVASRRWPGPSGSPSGGRGVLFPSIRGHFRRGHAGRPTSGQRAGPRGGVPDSQMTLGGRGRGLSPGPDAFAVPGRPIYPPVTARQFKIDWWQLA